MLPDRAVHIHTVLHGHSSSLISCLGVCLSHTSTYATLLPINTRSNSTEAVCRLLPCRAERNARVQEQTVSLKRVGEDLVLVSQRLESEKATRWVPAAA